MSLIQLKPRPLDRDKAVFRDDRLFIIACDDRYAPRQYFAFFPNPRVHVHVIPTIDGTSTAEKVLTRLLEFEHDDDDERWMLLDTDHCTEGTHLTGFRLAMREADQKGIRIALSKPCFELWLLLHHIDETKVGSLRKAKEVEAALKIELGQYNKTKLQARHFPLSSVAEACRRAEKLDPGSEIPQTNASRVYQLWKAIVARTPATQLPAELRSLLSP